MPVKITIEGPKAEVEAAFSVVGDALAIQGKPEWRHWDLPAPTECAIFDAAVDKGSEGKSS